VVPSTSTVVIEPSNGRAVSGIAVMGPAPFQG
jgi:hypothetical protein